MSEIETLDPAPLEPLETVGSWRALVRSFGALAAGEGAARLLSFVALIFLARRLGPDGFGLVTLGTTLVAWFALVSDAGTEMLAIRDVARRPGEFKAIAEPVLGLRLALSGLAMALLGVAAVLASARTSDRIVLWLFALCLPMLALNLRWMVLGLRASGAVALGNAAGEGIFVVGVVAFVGAVHDTFRVPLLEAAGELTYALVIFAAVRGRGHAGLRPRMRLDVWRRILRRSAPVIVQQVSRAAIYSFDVLLIAVLLGRTHVGIYGAAYKPVLFLAGALGLLFVSFLSSYSAAAAEAAPSLFRRTTLLTAAGAVAIAVLVAAGSGTFVSVFYGDAFANAGLPLAVLVWSVPAMAIGGGYGVALVAGDAQRALMGNSVAAAAFNVLGNLVGIPLFGITAAAAVTVASEVLTALLNYRSAVSRGLAPPARQLLRPSPSAAEGAA